MIFNKMSFDANPYPIEKAKTIPPMMILKLDSNSAVLMPAWPNAKITVIKSKKKKHSHANQFT